MNNKRHFAKYKDVPFGLCEQRGRRGEFITKRGKPIGQIKCQLSDGKWVSAVYGDKRTRKEAIALVHEAKINDRKKKAQ